MCPSGSRKDQYNRHPPITWVNNRDLREQLAGSRAAEAGDTPLWEPVEWAYQLRRGVDRPGWDRLGLTVDRDGRNQVWIDKPERFVRALTRLKLRPDTGLLGCGAADAIARWLIGDAT